MSSKSIARIAIAMCISCLSACDDNHVLIGNWSCIDDECDVPEYCENSCIPDQKKCSGTKIVSCLTDDKGCGYWSKPRNCGDNMHCDENAGACVEGCTDECKLGETLCEGSRVRRCEKGSDDQCLHWSEPESCGENLHCDETTNACVDGCVDECEAEGSTTCVGMMYRECGNFDGDACLEYSDSEFCDTEEECNESTGKCQRFGCETECNEGETVCDADNKVAMTCVHIENSACNDLVTGEVCGAGRKCTIQKGEAVCVDDVEEICTIDSIQCSEDGRSLMKCEANTSGNEWKSETCAAGTRCDAAAKACIETCQLCDENAVQCSEDNRSVQLCVKDEKGCTSWSEQEKCGNAQSCQNGKCDYSCGDDCEPFSLVIIPDPQNYTKETATKTTYHKEMEWIVRKKDTSTIPNLQMVVHMGDVTDHNIDKEWKIAREAQDILKNAGIRFSVTTGNHDYASGTNGGRSKTKFSSKFPKSYLQQIDGYVDSYQDANNAFTFKAGNQEYLVVHLEYAPRQQAVCWANQLIDRLEHKNKKVILATHANLSRKASYGGSPNIKYVENGAAKDDLWKGITSRHSNIIMILNGHVGGSEHRQDKGVFGNTVSQVLTDYQFERPCNNSTVGSCTNHCRHTAGGGNGWVRVVKFYPKENKIDFESISATSGDTATFTKEKKDTFYCSSLFDLSNKGVSCNDCGQWYNKAPSHADHKFTLKYDFTTPQTNAYDDKYYGFIQRSINYTGSGDQLNPAVATNKSGRLVYVWEDDSSSADGKRHDGTNNAHDIFARIMLRESCEIDGNHEVIINSEQKGHQSDPDVAMDEDGNFVVVWTDDSDNNGESDVMMRGFNADGSERFAAQVVNTDKTRDQYQARIAMAPDGQFVVTWTDKASGDKTPQVRIRGFNADGSQAFEQRDVADKVAGTRVRPDVFMASNHDFVVAWEDDEDGNGGTQTTMRLFKADGTPKNSVQNVNTKADGSQNAPSISGKTDGSKFIVAWQNVNASKYAIMARTFDAEGRQIDADFKFSAESSTKFADPQVCMNDAGNAMAAWYTPATKSVVYRSFVGKSVSGSETAVNNPVNTSSGTPKAYQPAVACVPGGSYAAIAFADDRDGNSAFEIYAAGKAIK